MDKVIKKYAEENDIEIIGYENETLKKCLSVNRKYSEAFKKLNCSVETRLCWYTVDLKSIKNNPDLDLTFQRKPFGYGYVSGVYVNVKRNDKQMLFDNDPESPMDTICDTVKFEKNFFSMSVKLFDCVQEYEEELKYFLEEIEKL